MRVARFLAKGKEPEHLATGYMKRWLLDQRLRHPEAVRIFGFDVEVSDADRKRAIRAYEVWAPVPRGVRPSQGVRVRQVPGALYAVLRVRDALLDPYARIPAGWKQLSEWVRLSRDVQLTEGLCLEEHVQTAGSIHLDLFAPVVRVERGRRASPRRRRVPQ